MSDTSFPLHYFSEDNDNIGAECPFCGKVLKIPKIILEETSDGFKINEKIQCPCRKEYSIIILGDKKRNTLTQTDVFRKSPKSTSKKRMKKIVCSYLIFFILLKLIGDFLDSELLTQISIFMLILPFICIGVLICGLLLIALLLPSTEKENKGEKKSILVPFLIGLFIGSWFSGGNDNQ